MAAGAAYAGSKMLGAKEKGLLAATEDGKSAKAKSEPRGPQELGLSTAKKDTAVKDKGPVKTTTTIMDNKPAKAKKNEDSIRTVPGTNKVFTIKGAKEGNPAKEGNTKSVFKGADGYLRQGENSIPMTPGRFGTFKASKDIAKGAKPANLGLKSGGRAGYKSGGSSVKKSMGKALRGGGKVMR